MASLPTKTSLTGKTVFVTGASRGIGRAIAIQCARAGANIVVAAKTVEPHPSLAGTIYTVASELSAIGARALPVRVDVRLEEDVEKAVAAAVAKFGGIDALVNNASAISRSPIEELPLKRFDLMMAINVRGSIACAKACLPHLKESDNSHILNIAPPMSLSPKWYGLHLGNAISKYAMSMCTLGFAEEFRKYGIAANSLWPKTLIDTDAVRVFFPDKVRGARRPEIMAKAAEWIMTRESREFTGQMFIDEDVMRHMGETDLSAYAVDPKAPLAPDIYID